MRPRCEIIIQNILPAFRALIAKRLIEQYKFTQTAAAQKLGTTQAAISHYIRSKRGEKQINQLAMEPQVMEVVNEITNGIIHDTYTTDRALLAFCKLCNVLKSDEFIVNFQQNL